MGVVNRHMPALSGRSLPRSRMGYRTVQVLEYIHQVIAIEGRAPSYGMIRDALGLSTKGEVCVMVERLERRGLLSRVGDGRVRRIRLVGAN